jgi:hypothetical protein
MTATERFFNIFVGMIQRFTVTEGYQNAQQLTQKLLAKAILR